MGRVCSRGGTPLIVPDGEPRDLCRAPTGGTIAVFDVAIRRAKRSGRLSRVRKGRLRRLVVPSRQGGGQQAAECACCALGKRRQVLRADFREIVFIVVPDHPVVTRVGKRLEPLIRAFQRTAPLLNRELVIKTASKTGNNLASTRERKRVLTRIRRGIPGNPNE
jgi:hypothetical protein